MEYASTENLSTIGKGGKCKYGKRKYKICKGGKHKYGNGKSDLNPQVTEKYHCQSTETAYATSEHGWRNPTSAVVRKVSQASNGIFAANFWYGDTVDCKCSWCECCIWQTEITLRKPWIEHCKGRYYTQQGCQINRANCTVGNIVILIRCSIHVYLKEVDISTL